VDRKQYVMKKVRQQSVSLKNDDRTPRPKSSSFIAIGASIVAFVSPFVLPAALKWGLTDRNGNIRRSVPVAGTVSCVVPILPSK